MNADRKNVIWNAIGATASAFTSLFFVIIATRINGVEKAGIFSYGFATACILYVLGSYVVRVYQVTDTTSKCSDWDYVQNRVISCAAMVTIATAFIIIKGYDSYKASIIMLLCLFKCAEAFSEVLYGIIQKNEKLYEVGISLMIKAVSGVGLFWTVDLLTDNMPLSCAMIVVANLIIILAFDIPNVIKTGFRKSHFSIRITMSIFRQSFFTFVLTVLTTYLINAPRYAIDDLLNDSSQTIYGIIILPATFMLLLGQYIIHPLLTKMAAYIDQKRYLMLRKMIARILLAMLVLGIAVFIVAFMFEEPVLSFMYGLNLKAYKECMMIIIAGSVFYGLETVISYILISFRRTGIQAAIFAIVSVVVTFLSYHLIPSAEITGASIVYLIGMLILTTALFVCFFIYMSHYRKIWNGV